MIPNLTIQMEERKFDLVGFTDFAMQDHPQSRVLCSSPFLSHSAHSRDSVRLPSGELDPTRTLPRSTKVPTSVW
jgi:hypothetical protein